MENYDPWNVYEQMYRSRLFEEIVTQLWNQGMISGEMHLGTGEEAIDAGVIGHLREGDALALDHRNTPVLLMRGVEPMKVLRELLGSPDGLCSGMGGHMHMFSKEHLAASSGIVGAGGPTAAGFALAAEMLRPGCIAVTFFGEGAMNQGMLMETLNLATAWRLPVLFVCKNDGWQITEKKEGLSGKDLLKRAESLGVPGEDVDGSDAAAVWQAAGEAIDKIRVGKGPFFLHASCIHLEGHFLGFQLLRTVRNLPKEGAGMGIPLAKALLQPKGAPLRERLAGLATITGAMTATSQDPRTRVELDPLWRARHSLMDEPARLAELENRVQVELQRTLEAALAEA